MPRIALRIPGWCDRFTLSEPYTQSGGYVYANVPESGEITLSLDMPVQLMESNAAVQNNAGRVAVMRGPIVYCMEGMDNGDKLWSVVFAENGKKKVVETKEYVVPVLELAAFKREETNTLYRIKTDAYEPMTAKLIPYYAYANRGISDMQVWTQVK